MGCLCSKAVVNYPPCPTSTIEYLKEATALNKGEIQHLYNRYCLIAGVEKGQAVPTHIHKWNFYSGQISLNPMLPTLLRSMFGEKNKITFVDFVHFLSTFQGNTLKTTTAQMEYRKNHKLQILFQMYDHTRDGRITRADLIMVVHRLFSVLLTTRQIMHIVDEMMYEMDITGSNQVLYADFLDSFSTFDMSEKLVIKIPEYHGKYAG